MAALKKEDEEWKIKPGRVIVLDQKKSFYLRRVQQRNSAPITKTRQSFDNTSGSKPKSVETVFKVINWGKGQYSAKNQALYIGRAREKDKRPLKLYNELGEEINGKDAINLEMGAWNLIPDKENRSTKWANGLPENRAGIPYDQSLNKRQTVHMIFSLPDQEPILKGTGYTSASDLVTNRINRFSGAIRQAAQETFAVSGHRYVMAVHSESPYGDKIHAHLIVKVENDKTKRQLRMGREDLMVLRQVFTTKCAEKNFNVYASQRLDRPELAKQIKEGKAPLRNNKTAQQIRAKTKQGQVFMAKAPNWYVKHGEKYEKRRLGISDEPSIGLFSKIKQAFIAKPVEQETVIYKNPQQPLNANEKAAIARLDKFFQLHFKNPDDAKQSFLELYAESSKLAVWTANSHPLAFGEITGKKIEQPLTGRGISRIVPPQPSNPTSEIPQEVKNLQGKVSAKNYQTLKIREEMLVSKETAILQQKVSQLKIDERQVKGQENER